MDSTSHFTLRRKEKRHTPFLRGNRRGVGWKTTKTQELEGSIIFYLIELLWKKFVANEERNTHTHTPRILALPTEGHYTHIYYPMYLSVLRYTTRYMHNFIYLSFISYFYLCMSVCVSVCVCARVYVWVKQKGKERRKGGGSGSFLTCSRAMCSKFVHTLSLLVWSITDYIVLY